MAGDVNLNKQIWRLSANYKHLEQFVEHNS